MTKDTLLRLVGGNLITSLHRKLGDMYEALFVYLLQKSFNLDENDLHFSVDVQIGDRIQKRSTDGLIRKTQFNQRIPQDWIASLIFYKAEDTAGHSIAVSLRVLWESPCRGNRIRATISGKNQNLISIMLRPIRVN